MLRQVVSSAVYEIDISCCDNVSKYICTGVCMAVIVNFQATS